MAGLSGDNLDRLYTSTKQLRHCRREAPDWG